MSIHSEVNLIEKNLDKAKYYLGIDRPVEMIYFSRIDKDYPSVSLIGDPNILIQAVASIIYSLAANITGEKSLASAACMLITIEKALWDMYGGIK